MNKLILVMVLLFSATATAENLKYKRSDKDNMNMHLSCGYMAESIELSAARIDSHQQESLEYYYKAWDAFSDRDKAIRNGWYNVNGNYQAGFVDGLFSALNKTERSNIYYDMCEDDKLLFSLKAK